MKRLFFLLLSTTAFAAPQAPKETPKPEPVSVYKQVEVFKLMPDGKIQLSKDYSWEDAAYTLLNAAKQYEQGLVACNEANKPKEKKK